MLLSDFIISFDDWRIALLDYAALILPVAVGIYGRRFRLSRMLLPAALSCSLLFFAVSNFAVWAFGGLYSHDMAGLVKCYVLALPFLQYTVAGDLIWVVVLFGGAAMVQRLAARSNAVPA
jgi:hypothetical protein